MAVKLIKKNMLTQVVEKATIETKGDDIMAKTQTWVAEFRAQKARDTGFLRALAKRL